MNVLELIRSSFPPPKQIQFLLPFFLSIPSMLLGESACCYHF
ncbi:hypothetical protein CHCC15311_1356 [Bacillus licheniformis]|nr:hypothetical protein CHCC15311_1356 [Bacillus licheniformis]